MSILRVWFLLSLGVMFAALPCRGDEAQSTVTPLGFAAFDAGQVVRGFNNGLVREHVWQEDMLGQVGLSAVKNEHLVAAVVAECRLTFSYPQYRNMYATQQPEFSWYLDQAQGIYKFGDTAQSPLAIGIGYFPFKYNPDVRNLGEYLFRTGTYPGYIINDFDYPQARLLGLHLSSTLFGTVLRQDLLLTSEMPINPVQDYSLSYLASGTFWKIAQIGAGVSFSHLFSVDEEYTTPKDGLNMYYSDNDTLDGDTMYYTFRGTKLMGRLTIDPKPLFNSALLGENDLKLYTEAAVIGLENQGTFYSKISERIPVMIGFNVPAFKLLDVLAVECEWYGSPYPNSYHEVFSSWWPQPAFTSDTTGIYKKDNVKWSVYAKREVAKGWNITAQVANDHMRILTHDIAKQDKEESLRDPKDWHYMIRSSYQF